MRNRVLFLAATLALVALPALGQSAGFTNYHYEASINCIECHSMHASAHDNLGAGGAITSPASSDHYYPAPNPGGGNPQLLKAAADAVCTSCHDGQTTAPDVVEETNSSDSGYERSAGHIQMDTTGGGHFLGTLNDPPGWNATSSQGYFTETATLKLYCQSCHNPHGNLYFRNLGPTKMTDLTGTDVLPTYNKSATWGNAHDAQINLASRTMKDAASFSDYYGIDAVDYAAHAPAAPATGDSITANNRMDYFCGVCHGNFHGGATGDTTVGAAAPATGFKRHPTSKVTAAINSAGGFADLRLYQAGKTPAAGDSPGCITCHRAHGNNNPFALIRPDHTTGDQTTTTTVGAEEGNGGSVKTLCKACHTQGGANNG